MKLPTRAIATGLFSGYSPFAPGTAGTAVALVVYCLLPSPLRMGTWIVFLSVLFLAAVFASYAGEEVWGKDPGPVVIDEVVGFFCTMFALPQSIGLGVAGFFLFRVLDIVKPPPARQAEALPGGWGVVVDDVLAGVYGNLILRAIFWWVR